MDAASPFCAPGVQRRIFEFRRVPESHFRVQMKPFGWSGESPGSLRGESVDAQGRPELPGRFATNSNAGNLVNNGVGQGGGRTWGLGLGRVVRVQGRTPNLPLVHYTPSDPSYLGVGELKAPVQ